MQLFAQLAKYDENTGYFEAVAADESLDKAGEIFDYAKSKPHFESWSQTISKASGGKSLGNVRAMHGKVAAGKLTGIDFDDDGKAIKVTGLVVDSNERTKMAQGVYTGVSIGGRYGSTWDDPVVKGVKRYEAIPSEISIVDLPCNSNAHFTVVKGDGSEELRKFEHTTENVEALEKWADGLDADERESLVDALLKIAERKDVSGADKWLQEAGERLVKAEGADRIANAICAALGNETLAKSLWDVARFAELLASLGCIQRGAVDEAVWEGDDSPVPAQMQAAIKPLVDVFLAMAAEEADEATQTAKAAGDELNKSEEDAMNTELQKSLDDTKAELKKVKTEHTEALAKVTGERDEATQALEKITAEHDELVKAHDAMKAQLDEINAFAKEKAAEVEKLNGQVAKPKGSVTAVEKTTAESDLGGEQAEDDKPVLKADGSVDHVATAQKEMRKSYTQPVPMHVR